LCGLAAAWIAAGSTGLLGHPLRHALALFFLAATFLLGLPRESSDGVGVARSDWAVPQSPRLLSWVLPNRR